MLARKIKAVEEEIKARNKRTDLKLRTGLEKTYAWIYDEVMHCQKTGKASIVNVA